MKKLKRMLAVLLTAIMTLAMATTAFAAQQTAPTGTLTVNVNKNNTLEGQTIKIYKLFDLTVNGDKYAYTVNADYKSAIATALGLTGSATSEDLYKKLAGYQTDSTDIQKFADDFTEAALTAQPPMSETKSSGKINEAAKSYQFTDLAYGYYLVYQTGTKELQSSLVSVDKANMEITLKGEAPSIEKTADNETVEIGQVVTYTITGVIPDTTGYEQYTYKIHDTLTEGLDFVKNENGDALDNATKLNVSVQIGEGNATSMNAELETNNKRKMTLDLSNWVRTNSTAHKGKTFTVTYYAKVNKNAVVTEKNSAELEYGNNPENTTTTTPSEAKTPTYPLQIHKYEKDKVSEYLAGATFRLYNSEEDANKDQNPIAVTGSDGNYTVDPVQAGDNKKYDMVSVATELAEHKGMNLRLNGLKAGVYWLMETQAPDGYNGVTAPIKITIAKSQNDNVNDWIITKGDGQEETDKVIDIENTTGTILPGTGGMGTVLFTVIGVALVLIIAASFVISRRKRAE